MKPEKTEIGLAPNNNFSASLWLRSGLTATDVVVNVDNVAVVGNAVNLFYSKYKEPTFVPRLD